MGLAIADAVRRGAWKAGLLLGLAAVATVRTQAPAGEPRVIFETPVDRDYVSGPSTVRVRIEPPDAAVSSVSISADGKVVCTLQGPPFECPWNAGPKVASHVVRASVSFADGRRAAAMVRTTDAGYVEQVDVDVVQVTATVTDREGGFVRGLTERAFRIAEDDVPQVITSFAAENIPLEIVVAIDVSYSMTPAMPVVKQAVKKFLEALRPTDKVTVIGFNDSVFTVARPTADLPTRLRAIDRMTAWGSTALYDVIVHSIEQLGRKPGRRALVVFTDGEDVASRVPLETAERRLEASDAMVYAIGQGRAVDSRSLRTILERLAAKSGGRAFFKDLDELGAVFDAIIEELSNQYLLGYVSTNQARDGKWRKITVQAPGRDLRVRARQGYRVEPR